MISTFVLVATGIVIKTLVPMPYVDVIVHNAWASVLGYSKKLYSEKVTTTTV